jgi:hypothetical protein
MTPIKKAWDNTKGYKTVTGAALLLLFQLFSMIFPHALNGTWDSWINKFIDFIIATGILDKIYRSRKDIKDWITSKFLWVKNKFKKKKP